MFSLDRESAGLIAKILRGALVASPTHHYLSAEVSVTACAWWNEGKRHERAGHGVVDHGNRFRMLPTSRYVKASWHLEGVRGNGLPYLETG